jgi:hypothetical protein
MKLVHPAAATVGRPFRLPWLFRSPIVPLADPGCSFCGQSHRDGAIVVASPDAAICDRCTARVATIMAGALGQSVKGAQNACSVLFRPSGRKARVELRRRLVTPPD